MIFQSGNVVMSINDNKIFSKLTEKYASEKDKIRKSLIELKEVLKTESKESSQMLDIYYKYVAGQKINNNDLEKANEQLKDVLKGLGALGIFALPGGVLAIAFLVKLGKYFGVDILPKKTFDD
tara:strand:- start:475 stop:843 length:369 start_codon:yes stop_codon:yes gene_type:complete